MNDCLAMLFDADLGKWEGRLIAVALAGAGWILKLAITRLVKRFDAAQKSRHADHIRLYQHDAEIVEKLRAGKAFPTINGDTGQGE